MKKILAATLMFLMLLVFAFGACAEAVTGDWYAEIYGMAAQLTVNEDGTYVLAIAGETQNGTWVLEDTSLVMDKGTDMEGIFSYDADAQILDMEGQLTFTRTPVEQWVPAAVRSDAVVEDFTGEWNALRVDAFGAVLPVETAELYMTASIEGKNVSLTIIFIDPQTYEGEAVLEGTNLILTIPAEDEFTKDMVFTGSALEDGSICIATELFSSPVTFYMEKIGEIQ